MNAYERILGHQTDQLLNTTRRRTLRLGLLAGLSLAVVVPATAQTRSFPTKPVRLVVAFAAGGAGDFLARLVQQHLQERWGQTVMVENKPGASGTIAADLVAKAPADGHTLLVTNQLIVQAPNAIAKVPYDVMRDLAPVAELGGAPLILAVNASATQARTLPELVSELRAKPGTHSYASVGVGSMGHLYGAQLNETAKLDLVHIPYKGSAQVVTALVGGEVITAFSDFATLKAQVDAGKLRLLAVSKPDARTSQLPTFASYGYQGLDSYSWIGMFAPAKTPPAAVQQIAADVNAVLRLPEVARRVADLGLDTGGGTQQQFAAMVAADFLRWPTVMKNAGINRIGTPVPASSLPTASCTPRCWRPLRVATPFMRAFPSLVATTSG
jgi:tripartite-type tricarboxylate transporter receptor subunit TctC